MSGGGGTKATNRQIDYQNETARKQYEYDKKVYDFQWNDETGEMWRQYDYAQEGLELQKQNDTIAREYQQETAQENWEHGLSIHEYQHEQEQRAYRKSSQVKADTLAANEMAFQQALKREDMVLEEQFIEMAFQNQGILQDLYEFSGGKSYDKLATQLNLKKQEGDLDSSKTRSLQKLQHTVDSSQFSKADAQLNLVDQFGEAQFAKGSIAQKAFNQEAANRFDREAVGYDVAEGRSREQIENDIVMREYRGTQSKAAFDAQERYVEHLQQLGHAQLSQSGRSQGKTIQMVFAQMGRQSAYEVDTLTKGKNVADAKMQANRVNTLNLERRSELAKNKLDYSSLSNIIDATRNIQEVDRNLKISGAKGELDLSRIKQNVFQAVENTELEQKDIHRNLKNAQTDAAVDLHKIDWDIENYGSRFEQNQAIIKTQLDSAVKASVLKKQDYALAKYGADLEADARAMLEPVEAPLPPPPKDLPVPIYQDLVEPQKPPEPVERAQMAHIAGPSFGQRALTAGVAGLGTYAMLQGTAAFAKGGSMALKGLGAGPIGLAVGLGTLLFS